MKRILTMVVFAVALLGQETASKVVRLKNIHPNSALTVLNVMSANKVRYQVDEALRVVVLSGPADLVGAMETAIQALDVPTAAPRNVELTFHMLLASPQPDGGTVPPELNGVATQLRNVFGLKSVRVLETAVMRGREGRQMETNGLMPVTARIAESSSYGVSVKSTAINGGDKNAMVRLDGLRFYITMPTGPPTATQFRNVGLSTDIDVREGQKVVVGKSNVDGAAQSVFLVVTAKLVD